MLGTTERVEQLVVVGAAMRKSRKTSGVERLKAIESQKFDLEAVRFEEE